MNYIDQLFTDSKIVEVRYFNKDLKNRTCISGIFNDATWLRYAVNNLPKAGNLYCTLNEPATDSIAPDMFNRIDYDIKQLRNKDFKKLTRFIFDFDPVRPVGVASTDSEVELAKQKCVEFVRYMRLIGLPEPLIAMSGNGYHVQYRCNMPVTDENKKMLNVIYNGLKTKFNDDQVSFDTSIRNSGRIFRLYGTVNRKGDSTWGRPHRKAFHNPLERWVQMRPHHFERLYKRFKPAAAPPKRTDKPFKVSGKGNYATLNMTAWLSSHGLYEHHIQDNMHSVICPWESEHSESNQNDTIIYESDGNSWGGFHCKHSHCQDRKIRDVMDLFGDADVFCQESFK